MKERTINIKKIDWISKDITITVIIITLFESPLIHEIKDIDLNNFINIF